MKNLQFTFLLVFITSMLQAQTKNVFLDRAFWKTKPTVAIIDQKIKENNNPSALTSNGFDAVTNAILAQATNTSIKYLLKQKGNDVNKLTHDKRTYVFWAAYKGNLELVKHLIDNKARLDLKDSHNFSPLTFAAAAGLTNTKIYDVLIKNGIDIKNDVNENGANALLLVIPNLKDFALVDYFTAKGLSLTSLDNDGNGAFNYAAKNGNKKIAELLVKKGIPYKNLNKNGGNAFLLASRGSRSGYNSLAFFKYLENLGINPNITNNQGKNPIHNLAYGNKDIATFNYFISKGIDINKADVNGNTPLINATRRNSLEVIKLLVSKTTNLNHTNKEGKSALTNSLSNTSEVVKFLLEKNPNIAVTDAKGNNLNYYLFTTFNAEKTAEFQQKLRLLKAKGLNVEETQKDGNTLFHLAVKKQSIAMLNFIADYKIDINAKNKKGLSALQEAVLIAKNQKIIKHLLSKGADKNVKTDFDETLYDLAKENENLKNTDISFLK